jgi:hypothetical protein
MMKIRAQSRHRLKPRARSRWTSEEVAFDAGFDCGQRPPTQLTCLFPAAQRLSTGRAQWALSSPGAEAAFLAPRLFQAQHRGAGASGTA